MAKIFYNKALKVNPNDTAARDQLSELGIESVASNKSEENIISSDILIEADDVADSYSEEVKKSLETLQSTSMCVECPLAGVDMSSKDLSHNERNIHYIFDSMHQYTSNQSFFRIPCL